MRVDQYQLGYNLYENETGGSANAQTIALSPAITEYIEGMEVRFTAGFTNTSTAVTLNVNSVGATAVRTRHLGLPAIGSIVDGRTYTGTYNGTFWLVDVAPATLQAAVATTSGATVDLTGIPSGVKRVTLFLDGVSGGGTDSLRLSLGDNGGIETTGYLSIFGEITGTNACNVSAVGASSVGLCTAAAAALIYGTINLIRISTSTHRWMMQTQLFEYNNPAVQSVINGVAIKTLSAELDRLRLSWSGSDEFDAGSVSILVE